MALERKSVIVIGGGVAGIAAAVALSDAGLHVELFEKRPLLGGRASSYVDRETGARLDECQHGTMRCCTNLADVLERLGVHDQIAYHDVIHFLDGDGKRSVIKAGPLPAPLHTSWSFLCFRSLGVKDKIAIARGMIAMLRANPDPAQDAVDAATWFRQQKQTERAVKRFWEPILVSACNESIDRISCTHAFKIFRDGFLANTSAFHFGVPKVPLGTLYTEPTIAYLQKRGGCVHSRTIVDTIDISDEGERRVAGVTLNGGEKLTADYYVSALQSDLLLKALPAELTANEPYFARLKQIELSPIIGVHLWFDRIVDCPEALSLLDRETDWVFNKTKNFGLTGENGTYLSMVISAPGRLASLPKEDVFNLVLEEVRACVPETRPAEVVRWRVICWPKATFAPKPGVETVRPDQRSPIPNLFVAGEWTRTGWPSTMESAARSGYTAAEYILRTEGDDRRIVAPDLPASGLARLLGYRAAPRERLRR